MIDGEPAEHHDGNRVGQLTMRNLDITDTRTKLGIYAKSGLLSLGEGAELLRLENDKPD